MDLDEMKSCFDVPAARGPQVLAILVELDPIPDEDKRYPERVEKFCRNFVLRHVTAEITLQFLSVAVERMFTLDEVSDTVSRELLQSLQFKICKLFLPNF
jgi:hypothetical protein